MSRNNEIYERFYTDGEIQWFSPSGGLPNWSEPKEKQLACLIHEVEPHKLYLMFNSGPTAASFHLPHLPTSARWYIAVDTARAAPDDLFAAGNEPLWDDFQTYHLPPKSSAILLAAMNDGQRRQPAKAESK